MTENPNQEPPTDSVEDGQAAARREADREAEAELRRAVPKDRPEAEATGYAVWSLPLQRFVSGVTEDKPSDKDAKAAAAPHAYKVVRV